MTVEFTAHNIRLDDGTFTKPDVGYSMEEHPWFVPARRILDTVFPGDKKHLRLADLGCLEGGFAVEFARMGFQVLGIEVREANMAACNYVKSKTNLPNLTFAKDDAWNIAQYGMFDVIFCCGLLYHLDRPRQFLHTLSSVTKKLLILQTHFATDTVYSTDTSTKLRLPAWLQLALVKRKKDETDERNKYHLSELVENEGVPGRWFAEFDEGSFPQREIHRWSSWDNRSSFWIQREYLLQSIQDAGFDLVLEQFDSLGSNIVASMLHGSYKIDNRGTFIGIKTQTNPGDTG